MSNYDVAIIGAGIVGCSAAWLLNRQGLRVAVLEKGRIGGEQSSRNAGFIRQQGRDLREIPMARRALALWRQISAEVATDIGFHDDGILAPTSDAGQLEKMRRWAALAAQSGLHSQVMSRQEVSAFVPRLRGNYEGGLFTADDAWAEPDLATEALAGLVRSRGVVVHERCVAKRIVTQGGHVSGIETEAGFIGAGRVIVTAGVWAADLLAPFRVSLPLNDLRVSLASTEPFDHGLTHPIWLPDVLARPRKDGGLTIGPGTDGPFDFDISPRGIRLAPRFVPALLKRPSGVRINLGRHFIDDPRRRSAYRGDDASRYDAIRVPEPEPLYGRLAPALRLWCGTAHRAALGGPDRRYARCPAGRRPAPAASRHRADLRPERPWLRRRPGAWRNGGRTGADRRLLAAKGGFFARSFREEILPDCRERALGAGNKKSSTDRTARYRTYEGTLT
jgi:glycine/D-amino acid oxidase-like deaminating enzyme